MVIYVNGRYEAATANTEGMPSNTQAISIGKVGDTMAEFYDGTIDEVKIYSRALPAEEIRDQYTNSDKRVIYFFDDFESGDLSKWTNNGQIEQSPPDTVCLVDSVHAYSGRYAFHSKRVDTSGDHYHWAQIVKWGDDAGLYQYRELYYGWMMYLPSDTDSPIWQQLVEWMPEHEGGDYQIMLSLMIEQRTSEPGQPQILRLYRTTPDNSYKEMWTSPKTLSAYLGRWVKVDFYIKQGKGDGEVKMWLDDELVYQESGLDLRQHAPSLEGDWAHSLHLGLYAYDNPPAEVWYDDVYIANFRRTS